MFGHLWPPFPMWSILFNEDCVVMWRFGKPPLPCPRSLWMTPYFIVFILLRRNCRNATLAKQTKCLFMSCTPFDRISSANAMSFTLMFFVLVRYLAYTMYICTITYRGCNLDSPIHYFRENTFTFAYLGIFSWNAFWLYFEAQKKGFPRFLK